MKVLIFLFFYSYLFGNTEKRGQPEDVKIQNVPLMIKNDFLGVFYNNQSIKQFQFEKTEKSYGLILKALARDPDHSLYRLNLAFLHWAKGDCVKALKELEHIKEKVKFIESMKEISFAASFNKALCYVQQDNKEKALQEYQEALEIKPDSKEVKTNIELLTAESSQKGKGKGSGGQKDEKNKENSQEQGKDSQDSKQDNQEKEKQQEDNQNQNEDPQNSKSQKPLSEEEKKEENQNPQMLSGQDIRKILEELKDQEQKIRSKEFGSQSKDKPMGKDW